MIAGHGRETILSVPAQPILAVLGHYSLNLDGSRSQTNMLTRLWSKRDLPSASSNKFNLYQVVCIRDPDRTLGLAGILEIDVRIRFG